MHPCKRPSPNWWTFLATHAKDLVSLYFFTVGTVRFEILFVRVILAHDHGVCDTSTSRRTRPPSGPSSRW